MASPAPPDISRVDRTRDFAPPIRRVDHSPPSQFVPLRMNETLSMGPCVPPPGDVFVFRFRSQWQRISAHDAATWLTQDETRRAALLPSPALRYRYISARAVLRLAVARLLGCKPHAVDLRDDAKGRLLAQAARSEVSCLRISVMRACGSCSASARRMSGSGRRCHRLDRARTFRYPIPPTPCPSEDSAHVTTAC
jgi:hypothetical protein